MRARVATILLSLGFASCAIAQTTVKLTFDSPGVRQAWIADALPTGPPERMASFNGMSAELEEHSPTPSAKVFVLDTSRNALAWRPVDRAMPSWKLSPNDYSMIGVVVVRIEHKGKPVETATVSLSDAKRTQKQVIDGWALGEAQFFAVSPGTLKLSVLYRSGGRTADPMKVAFEVPAKRSNPEVVLVASISEPVATVDPTKRAPGGKPAAADPGESGAPAQKAPVEGRSGLGSAASWLLSLAVAGGILWAAFWFMIRNPELVKEKLQKLGVDVPEPAPATGDAVPMPSTPAPQAQIILGGAPEPSGYSASAEGGPPRLVAEGGESFEIGEGSTWIGREEGLPIALPNEPSVSRQHAQVTNEAGRVTVTDLQSTNGTFVNGSRIDAATELNPGDLVQFGSVRVRFER